MHETIGATPLVEAHLATQTKLLLAAIEKIQPEPTPFIARAFSGGTNSPMPLTSASRGIIRQVHNPTGAVVILNLATGANPETSILNLALAANAISPGLYIPFYAPLFVISGSGIIVTGDVFG